MEKAKNEPTNNNLKVETGKKSTSKERAPRKRNKTKSKSPLKKPRHPSYDRIEASISKALGAPLKIDITNPAAVE